MPANDSAPSRPLVSWGILGLLLVALISLGGLYFTSPGEHAASVAQGAESTVECAPLSTASSDDIQHGGNAEQALWTAAEQRFRDLCAADRDTRQTQIVVVTGAALGALVLLTRRRGSADAP